MALPSNTRFDMKSSSVKIDRREHILPTLNKRDYTMSTTSGETLIWYLPSLANTCMDGSTGFLRFTVEITNSTGGARDLNLDQGAWSLFQSLRVYGAGGQLIEEITDLNLLYNMLVDSQIDIASKAGLSTAWGVEEFFTRTSFTGSNDEIRAAVADAGATAALLNARIQTLNNARTGYSFGTIANGATATASFSIPIVSGLFALSEKVWPAYACQDDLRFELQLGTVQTCFLCSANPAANNGVVATITNPEIIVDYLHFTDPAAMATIQSVYAGRDLVIHATSWRNYQSTLAAGVTGNIQTILPSKLVSVKCLMQSFRPQAHTTQFDAYSLSSRVCPFSSRTDRWSLNCGGEVVPQHGIMTNVPNRFDQFFMQLQKAWHALNMMSHNGSLSATQYNVNAQAFGPLAPAPADNDESNRNAFLLGLNTDSVIQSSEVVLSGRDLSKITTYLEYRLNTAPAFALTVNTFLCYDILFVIGADGSVSSRF